VDDRATLLWTIAGTSATTFVLAIAGAARRNRRLDPDRVGWMPWTLVQLVAVLASVFSVALVLTGR
jgi:hypothetical protein